MHRRRLLILCIACASLLLRQVTTEEILNAMGFDGYHDGVNYMRAVSVIVVEKARGYFEQHLALLRLRLLHVMRRMTTHVGAPRQPIGHLCHLRIARLPPCHRASSAHSCLAGGRDA